MALRPLMDSKQLAALTGVPARTLDQWAYTGAGPPFIRVGRHRRYDEADVVAWLAENRHVGRAARCGG